MNKKWLILITCLIILILVITLVIPLLVKDNNEYDSKKTTREFASDIETLNDLLINGGSKKEIIELTKIKELENFNIMTGKDSYLNQKPSKEIIDTYNLNDYVTKSSKYISRLEKEIKNNFDFKSENVTRDNNYIYNMVTVKAYYYSGYIVDLEELKNQLLEKVISSDKKEEKANNYKAKVKAMEILDKKLKDYRNKNEKINIGVNYNASKKTYTKNSLYQYILTVQGFSYRNNPEMMEKNANVQTRMTEYIDEALTNGILDNDNILRLVNEND